MKKKKVKVSPSKAKLKGKKAPEEENSVYIQLSQNEAANSQRDILSYQMELIKMVKSIKKYELLKECEMRVKIELKKIIKDFNEDMRNLESNFPKVDKYSKKEKNQAIPEKKVEIEYYDESLETQLEQIRRKLEEIGR